MGNRRESSFELIRLVSQWFIVIYHIYLIVVYPATGHDFDKAIWLPLHIGVPLFVLISGYFGIRPSVRGFTKLLSCVIVYTVPVAAAKWLIFGGVNPNPLVNCVFPVSGTQWWYVRTYVCLYLISPVLNLYLKDISARNRLVLLAVLFYISNFMGFVHVDPSLLDGKNLPTFMLLYVIGDSLRAYRTRWSEIRGSRLLLLWVSVNVVLVAFYSHYGFDGKFGLSYDRIFFAYNSPGLIINAIVMFMVIGRLKFQSGFVNWAAQSSFAIYLVHVGCFKLMVASGSEAVAADFLLGRGLDSGTLLGVVMLMSLAVMAGCVAVDKILAPVWRLNPVVAAAVQKAVTRVLGR